MLFGISTARELNLFLPLNNKDFGYSIFFLDSYFLRIERHLSLDF